MTVNTLLYEFRERERERDVAKEIERAPVMQERDTASERASTSPNAAQTGDAH